MWWSVVCCVHLSWNAYKINSNAQAKAHQGTYRIAKYFIRIFVKRQSNWWCAIVPSKWVLSGCMTNRSCDPNENQFCSFSCPQQFKSKISRNFHFGLKIDSVAHHCETEVKKSFWPSKRCTHTHTQRPFIDDGGLWLSVLSFSSFFFPSRRKRRNRRMNGWYGLMSEHIVFFLFSMINGKPNNFQTTTQNCCLLTFIISKKRERERKKIIYKSGVTHWLCHYTHILCHFIVLAFFDFLKSSHIWNVSHTHGGE